MRRQLIECLKLVTPNPTVLVFVELSEKLRSERKAIGPEASATAIFLFEQMLHAAPIGMRTQEPRRLRPAAATLVHHLRIWSHQPRVKIADQQNLVVVVIAGRES